MIPLRIFRHLITIDLEFALELDPPEVPKGTIADDIFVVPYNGEGKKDASSFMIWDLRYKDRPVPLDS